jgi:hypothetical protein
MMVVNDAGDYPLRFDGTTWTTLNAARSPARPARRSSSGTTSPTSGSIATGGSSSRAVDERLVPAAQQHQGALGMIPLSGAATKGGKLLCGFTWSIDAGDGIDDKCVFVTDQGELLIFTGSDPATAATGGRRVAIRCRRRWA